MFGYSEDMTIKYKKVESGKSVMELEDSIISIHDILNSEVPEIPLETTYDVEWVVVNGKQIAHLPNGKNNLKGWWVVQEESQTKEKQEICVSIHDSTVHTLSFECELYLSKIKSYMVSKRYEEQARIYHQIHIDKGLGQILPYVVNWIQTTVRGDHFNFIHSSND